MEIQAELVSLHNAIINVKWWRQLLKVKLFYFNIAAG